MVGVSNAGVVGSVKGDVDGCVKGDVDGGVKREKVLPTPRARNAAIQEDCPDRRHVEAGVEV